MRQSDAFNRQMNTSWMATIMTSLSCLGFTATAQAESVRVYIGTYTRGSASEGIYLSLLDTESGALSAPKLVAKADNPSFLTLTPDGSRLYAAEETQEFDGKKGGSIHAFSVDELSGNLTSLGQAPTLGGAPCHMITDSTGQRVLFANYSGGSAGVYATGADGELTNLVGWKQHEGSSVNLRRQEAPHAHSINLDPTGQFAYVADLGIDEVKIYKLNAQTGSLDSAEVPSVKLEGGSGPRHFDIHPSGGFAYVINEMTSTIAAFKRNASNGSLGETAIQYISTLPAGFDGNNSTAHVEIHPSGKYLYGSNRGHDSIAVYAIDQESGLLSLVEIAPCGGKTPRNFGIDPTGKFLLAAGQSSDNISVFKIDSDSGKLTDTGHSIEVPRPVCVQFSQPTSCSMTDLFDGKSFDGWEGNMKWFRIEDGAVVAGSLHHAIPNNEFLVSEKSFGDFELTLKAKLIGEGKNAGIQFWSERIPNHHEMIGFQCDIGWVGDRSIWGALYDESRRRVMLTSVPLATQALAKSGQWHEFRIVAQGNSIRIWFDGALATHYIESQPDIPRQGRFGLQIHSGPPAEAWYKDIQVRELK